jgi:hypothetical protein
MNARAIGLPTRQSAEVEALGASPNVACCPPWWHLDTLARVRWNVAFLDNPGIQWGDVCHHSPTPEECAARAKRGVKHERPAKRDEGPHARFLRPGNGNGRH